MVNLRVERRIFTDDVTIGELYVNDEFMCYTLEDAVRDTKIYGKTAIPKGTYKVIFNMSNRFKRRMPLLLNVPNYEGVRIHAGNTHVDTDGCIILGLGLARSADSRFDWTVTQSRMAIEKFNKAVDNGEEVEITIVNKADDLGK